MLRERGSALSLRGGQAARCGGFLHQRGRPSLSSPCVERSVCRLVSAALGAASVSQAARAGRAPSLSRKNAKNRRARTKKTRLRPHPPSRRPMSATRWQGAACTMRPRGLARCPAAGAGQSRPQPSRAGGVAAVDGGVAARLTARRVRVGQRGVPGGRWRQQRGKGARAPRAWAEPRRQTAFATEPRTPMRATYRSGTCQRPGKPRRGRGYGASWDECCLLARAEAARTRGGASFLSAPTKKVVFESVGTAVNARSVCAREPSTATPFGKAWRRTPPNDF